MEDSSESDEPATKSPILEKNVRKKSSKATKKDEVGKTSSKFDEESTSSLINSDAKAEADQSSTEPLNSDSNGEDESVFRLKKTDLKEEVKSFYHSLMKCCLN